MLSKLLLRSALPGLAAPGCRNVIGNTAFVDFRQMQSNALMWIEEVLNPSHPGDADSPESGRNEGPSVA